MSQTSQPWIYLIGMGADGPDSLSAKAKNALAQADVLLSSQRLLALLPSDDRPRLVWQSPLSDSLPDIVALQGKRLAIIATGDPLHYGVGSWLLSKFSLDEMVILPGVSAFALACARLGWAQQKTELVTLHGRDHGVLLGVIAPELKIIALSEDARTPAIICQHLNELGYGGSPVTVFTHMGGAKEKRFSCLASQGEQHFGAAFEANSDHDFNVVAIECLAGNEARVLSLAPGMSDQHFSNFSKLSKREQRALAISKLAPQPGDIMWDVGAGSASIAVEFLRLAPGGKAYTFDVDPAVRAHQEANASQFGLKGRLLEGGTKLPAAESTLSVPAPDAVFIGGGVSMDVIANSVAFLKPGGRLVAHAVTLESETILAEAYAQYGGEISRFSVSRLDKLGASETHGFRPAMSITQWCWQKDRAL